MASFNVQLTLSGTLPFTHPALYSQGFSSASALSATKTDALTATAIWSANPTLAQNEVYVVNFLQNLIDAEENTFKFANLKAVAVFPQASEEYQVYVGPQSIMIGFPELPLASSNGLFATTFRTAKTIGAGALEYLKLKNLGASSEFGIVLIGDKI